MTLTGGQAKSIFEKLEVTGEQGDATDKQFVFPRQCLVLGDSGVGKTSLVKSLTGKPFDPKQQKTQGIDQCLVDNEWKNCNLKDLVFGDLWRFLKTGDVEVALIGNGSANSPVVARKFELITGFDRLFIYLYVLVITTVVLIGSIYNLPLSCLLLYSIMIYYVPLIGRCCAFQFEGNLRYILATFVFILSRRGLIVGLHLGLVLSNFNESYITFAGSQPLLGLVSGIVLVTLFLCVRPLPLPFGTGHLVKNETFIVILYFFRLLVSIFIGICFGFVAETSLRSVQETCSLKAYSVKTISAYGTKAAIFIVLVLSLVYIPLTFLPTKFMRNILSFQEEMSLGTFVTLIYTMLFSHCKLVPMLPEIYFVISFPLYFCSTFYQEWFFFFSTRNDKEHMYFRTSYMTLALMGNGAMNTKILRRALRKRFPSLKLKIVDFAGDKEYYAYHHMFLKREAVYVVVFNMAKLIENNFRNTNAGTKRLQFWLESVCSHVPPKAPIFLVGTHRGEMTKISIKTLNGHLKKHLWGLYCDELVVNDVDQLVFFPVENSNGESDAGVQILRLKIMSVAEKRQDVTGCNIPLSWITIQDAIINLKGNKKAKFCLTIQEFPTAFENFICTNWSEETLKYFHEKGLVIYLDKDPELSNWVLLKPEILVDIIIQLVTPPPQMIQEKGFRRDWKLLHGKGMLTKSLLTRIISTVQENEEAVTAFLEKYDLICPLSNKKVNTSILTDVEEHQPAHFVPSLLPMSAEGCIPVWHDNTTDKKFYVFFKRFLPEPLFHRLLSRAHKNSKLEFPNGPVAMFKDVGKFWMSPKQPYRLKLMKEEAIIEVTLSSR